MNQDEQLDRALALFRASGRAWSEHWMAAPAPPPPRRSRLRAAAAFAAAAAMGALMLLRAPDPIVPAAAPPFIPIPFVAPPAPYERLAITSMDLPVAALIAAGFDLRAADPAATIRADVLIGQDGRAHAIRILARSSN